MSKIAGGCAIVFVVVMLALVLIVGAAAMFVNPRTGSDTDWPASPLLAAPPPPLDEPVTLRIVTFNIQDMYILSEGPRDLRMRSIATRLGALDPDIVGFQEAFIARDREILKNELNHTRLKHHVYFPSATGGSGLMVSSAFPIREAYFHRYAASNQWYHLWEGDWWAGKGVSLTRHELPNGAIVDFYNTHAQAAYWSQRHRRGVRMAQMREMSDFINASRLPDGLAFLAGDMNSRIDSPEYNLAVEQAGLLRTMTIPSGIDHLYAVTSPRFTYETLRTVEIDDYVEIGEHAFNLSDHSGFLSEIRVIPAGSAAEDPPGAEDSPVDLPPGDA